MSLHDSIAGPVWLTANALLVAGMWEVARTWFRGDSYFEKVQHTLVLCWALVVGAGIALGTFGVLRAPTLLGAVSIAAILSWAAARRSSSHDNAKTPEHHVADTPVGSPPCDFDIDARARSVRPNSAVDMACSLAWCAWCALCIGRLVVSGLLQYPTNWDTLTYHLPFVDQWLSTGSLHVPGAMKWFFPGNSELVAVWMVAPFSGDFLAPLNNVPAIMLLALSANHLARIFGVATLTRHLGVLVLMSNYVVWHQLMDNKNDVAVVSLFFTSLVYAFRYAKDARTPDLLLTSVCLGLLAGVKYYAVAYAGIVGMVVLVLTTSSRGLRPAIAAAVVCLIGVLIWAGYWYGRNAYVTGSPFYPKTLFADSAPETGVNSALFSTTLWGNSSPNRFSLWVDALWRMTGPCHLASLSVLPCSLLWLLIDGWQLRLTASQRMQGNFRWALAAVTVASGILYLVTPFTVETQHGTLNMVTVGYVTIRLGLCFCTLMVLCAMIVVNDWVPLPAWCRAGVDKVEWWSYLGAPAGSRSGRTLSYACLLLALVQVGYQFAVEHRLRGPSFVIDRKLPDHSVPSLAVAQALILAGGFIFLCWQRQWLRRQVLWRAFAVSSLAMTAITAGVLGARWHSGFVAFYDQLLHTHIFTVLKKEVPERASICVLSQRSYPFAGSRRDTRVVQAHETAAQPGRFPSLRALLQYLYDQRADFAAVPSRYTLWNEYQMDAWSDQHPSVFTTTYEDSGFALKRVNRGALYVVLRTDQTGLENL